MLFVSGAGRARRVLARPGWSRQVEAGSVRFGWARLVRVRLGTAGMASSVEACLCTSRNGAARCGWAGWARRVQARLVQVRPVPARQNRARQGRYGQVRFVKARPGWVGLGRHGAAGSVVAGQRVAWPVWHVMPRRGSARPDKVRLVSARQAGWGLSGLVIARHG